jgi:hypothetical protein
MVFRSRQVPGYFRSLAASKKRADVAHGRGFRTDHAPPGFSDRLAIACVSLGSRSPKRSRTCRGFADRSPFGHTPKGRGEGANPILRSLAGWISAPPAWACSWAGPLTWIGGYFCFFLVSFFLCFLWFWVLRFFSGF